MGFLDSDGLSHFWGAVKEYVDKRPGGGIYTVDLSQYGIDIWDMVDHMTDEGLRHYEEKASDSYNFASVYGLELADGAEQTVVFVFPNFTYSIPVDKNYSMADVISRLGRGPLAWYNYTMTYDVASGRLTVFDGDGREVAIKVTANDVALTPTPPGNNHLPLLREITSGVYSGKQTYILLSDEDRGNHICPMDEGIISGTSPYIVWFNFTEGNLSGTPGQWRSFRAGIGVDSVCLDELTPGGSAQSEYSLEETRAGTWIDGKPLYRKVIMSTSPSNIGKWVTVSPPIQGVDVKMIQCYMFTANNMIMGLPDVTQGIVTKWVYNGNNETTNGLSPGFSMHLAISDYINKPVCIVFEYTKTTD